ncbi:MAG: hypothetical protein Q8K28_14310 [Hoeflea sp.]|uniref:hypothetical protein n=1 Tax=Hoeflea sp. TaxID=1940281 RepID=UPI00272FF382|nr:hypothetical protein [Hoeflea sp.]MDP2121067.1 hypothetical protein [Hoeflea sp.]
MFDSIFGKIDPFAAAVISSVVAAALIASLNILFGFGQKYFSEQRYRAYIPWWLRLTLVIAASFGVACLLFPGQWIEAAAGVCFVGLVACLFKLFKLSRIGVYDFDVSVRTGFNYKSALKAARRDIAFLGTGASKLTSSEEFEAAIERCQAGVPNRFLLIHPNSPVLRAAARQYGVSDDDYSLKVQTSIEKLARLASSRGFKIEVRFQDAEREDDLESFRLMFIDDSVCLFSFNAYGRGDGSALPQLIVQSRSRPEVERALYYGLRRYFDRRWATAKPWNIDDFLGKKKR